MNNQIKKGWWVACGGFLFAFIIQAMLVKESYQHERSLFVEKVEISLNAAIDELSVENYVVGDSGKRSIASIDRLGCTVNIMINNHLQKFPLLENYDRNLVTRQAFYDLCDKNRWCLDSLNMKLQKKLGIDDIPVELCLCDSLGNEIEYVGKDNISGRLGIETKTIKLGFITPRVLYIHYVFPLNYYMAMAGDRLYMAGLFFAMLLLCFYLLFRTIWDEKKRQVNQKKLVDSLVHNLKNPILACSAAFSAVKSMYSQKEENEQEQKMIDLMDQSLQKAKRNVEELLSKQATAKGIRLSLQCIDVNKLFQELIAFHKDLRPENKQVHFRLDVQLSGECPLVGDRSHLYGALGNLIDNAMKYSGNEVEITLSAYREKKKMILKVIDNGWGISADQQKRIFESGFRASSLPGGSGIGLHYTQMVAEAHHGTIRVESTEGKGSAFIMELPRRRMFNNLKRKLCLKR